MIIEYESIADANFYCYFVKSGTVFSETQLYTIKATPHFHRNIEFLFITRGVQTVTVDGETHELKEGEILFVYFEPFHWFFDKKVFPQIMSDVEKNKDLFAFIEKWYEEHLDNNDRYGIFMKCNELFRLITQKYEIKEPVISKQNELVIAALKYIKDHYTDENLSLKSCSDAIGYSKEYVSKQFNSVMGTSFKGYVNSLRIQKFQELEQAKKGTKQELAVMCGFKSLATFYRALKNIDE